MKFMRYYRQVDGKARKELTGDDAITGKYNIGVWNNSAESTEPRGIRKLIINLASKYRFHERERGEKREVRGGPAINFPNKLIWKNGLTGISIYLDEISDKEAELAREENKNEIYLGKVR